MKKRALIVILVIAVIIAFVATVIKIRNDKNNGAPKTIRVNEVTRSVFYAPQYVAINNGYFKKME